MKITNRSQKKQTKVQIIFLLSLVVIIQRSYAVKSLLNTNEIKNQLLKDPCSLKQVIGNLIKENLKIFSNAKHEEQIIQIQEKIRFFGTYLKRAKEACDTKLNSTQNQLLLAKGENTFQNTFGKEVNFLKNSKPLFQKLLKFKDQIMNGFKLIDDITYNYRESCGQIFKIFGKEICQRSKRCTSLPLITDQKIKDCQHKATLKSKFQFCQEYGQSFDQKFKCFVKLKLSSIKKKVKKEKIKTKKQSKRIAATKKKIRKEMEKYRICQSCLKRRIIKQKMIMKFMLKQVSKVRMMKYKLKGSLLLEKGRMLNMKKLSERKKHLKYIHSIEKRIKLLESTQQRQIIKVQKMENNFNKYLNDIQKKEKILSQLRLKEKNEIFRLQNKTSDLKMKLIKERTKQINDRAHLEKEKETQIVKQQDATFIYKSRIIIKEEHMIHKDFALKIWKLIAFRKKIQKEFKEQLKNKKYQESKKLKSALILKKKKALLMVKQDITTLRIQEKIALLKLTSDIDNKLNLKRKMNMMSIKWVMRRIERGKQQIQALSVLCRGASPTGKKICKGRVEGIQNKMDSLRRKVWTKLSAEK